MQDGYTQSGAGPSDMRVAGEDLQHARQQRTADEAPNPHRMVTYSDGVGGPIKQYLADEMSRHMQSKELRLKDLYNSYTR